MRNRTRECESLPPDAGAGDAVLVSQARQGDARAFALLYRRYLDGIYDFVAHQTGSDAAAEDATQTVFLRALVSLPACKDGEHFAGWLFGIARHVVADHHRSTYRRRTAPLEDADDLEDPAESPEELAVRSDRQRALEEARAHCLNDRERELLDLRLQGLNDRQIGVALGVGHGAVRMRQSRLLVKLRDCLGLAARETEASRVGA